MQGKFIIIPTEGEIVSLDITIQPTLEELQAAVGGWLEGIGGFDTYEGAECVAFCNEEGKLHGLPENPRATAAWREAFGSDPQDILVGDIIVITGDDELLGGV